MLLETYRVGLHHHSTFTDGEGTPRENAKVFNASNVDIAGLSDHWCVAGNEAFIRAFEIVGEVEGKRRLGLFCEEVGVVYGEGWGDIHVTITDRDMARKYGKWRKLTPYVQMPLLIPFMERMIGEYDALITYLHPQAKVIHGLPHEVIERTVETLGPERQKNQGMEVHNLMSYVLGPKQRYRQEEQNRRLANRLWLTQFAFSDGHTLDLLAAVTTRVQMTELTEAAYHQAFVERRTVIEDIQMTPLLYAQVFSAAVKAQLNSVRDRSWLVKP